MPCSVQTISEDDCNFDESGKPHLKTAITFRGRTRAVQTLPRFDLVTPTIALDGEFQTVYEKSISKHRQRVGRISIVNYYGDVIYDVFAYYPEHPNEIIKLPPKHLKLGVYWRDIKPGNGALHIRELEHYVSQILNRAEIVVGHAIQNDIAVFTHEVWMGVKSSRDTQLHHGYRKYARGSRGLPKLAVLASEVLGWEIQGEEHSSVEDAQATMLLYRHSETTFEDTSSCPSDDYDYDLDDGSLLSYEGELQVAPSNDEDLRRTPAAQMPEGTLSAVGEFWKAGANTIKAGLGGKKTSVL